MKKFDAIVIGAGQAGPPLVEKLTQEGRHTAIIEHNLFGGTCVNVGCIPTKTLVGSARVAQLARRAAEFGVDVGTVNVDMRRVKERWTRFEVTRTEVSPSGSKAWTIWRSSAGTLDLLEKSKLRSMETF